MLLYYSGFSDYFSADVSSGLLLGFLVELGSLHGTRSSKIQVGSRVRPETPEEGRKTHRPKRCEYKNKDEDKIQNPEWWKSSRFVIEIQTSKNIVLISWRQIYNVLLIMQIFKLKYNLRSSSYPCRESQTNIAVLLRNQRGMLKSQNKTTKTEMNNEWNIIFFKSAFNTFIIPMSFT